MNEDTVTTLNDLIQLDIDAVHAYSQAIDACEVAEVRESLTSFKGDHERHIAELERVVRGLGGQPPRVKDIKGFVIEGFTAIVSQGDRSALMAMRGNEEITTRRYDAARRANVPADVLQMIEANYKDEVRHLDWVKLAIDRKAWEKGRGRAA
jgi:uncharacterized protein (TIGR02284 family)